MKRLALFEVKDDQIRTTIVVQMNYQLVLLQSEGVSRNSEARKGRANSGIGGSKNVEHPHRTHR
jgi:hypothetical protein